MGKKKGAGNKLAKMSEEERLRYLQHRAEIEEEARRRKQQLISIFMKNKLKREEAFSRLNLAKINQEWRSILRNIKCDELKIEIKSVEEYFDDALTRKNDAIQRLLNDLDENEEMYSTMLHAHMENIERLIALHADRISFLKTSYLNEKKSMLNQYHKEIQTYKERKIKAHVELECVFYGLESIADNDRDKVHNRHLKKADDVKSGLILKLQTITNDREQQMEKLWKEFQDVLNEYLHETEEYHNEYIELRQRDDEDTKVIRLHYNEVARATEQIGFFKLDLENLREEQSLHIEELLKYKKLLHEKQRKIKSEMDDGLLKDKNNMRHMVVCSHNAAAKLKDILKRGENILQIAVICKKLETEREQVVPFGRKKTLFGNHEHDLKKPPEEFKEVFYTYTLARLCTKEKAMFIVSNLENFWLRYNNARIDCACLSEEKMALKEENRELKEKLKAYLTTVTIANGGGNAKDKLRPSSMKVERVGRIEVNNGTTVRGLNKDRRRPVTCFSTVQEGNLSVAVRSKNLTSGKFRKEPEIYSIVQGGAKIVSQ